MNRSTLAVVAVSLILFTTPFLLVKCSKKGKTENGQGSEVREFVQSPVYKDFTVNKRFSGKVSVDAARLVRLDKTAAVVHIPIMKHTNVEGAIIGLPTGYRGQYELLYQDNRAALSGTGNIYLYTSANEMFGRIELKNGVIKSIDSQDPSAVVPNGSMRIDCGFLCRLNKCYTAVKAKMPGEAICDLLDIFLGVCSSATVATCLIKMATN